MAERTMAEIGKVRSREETLGDELKSLGMGIKDLDSFTGSAEETLEKLRAIICGLMEVTSELNSETLKENQKLFQESEEAIEKRKTEFETGLINFKAQVEIQYPNVPFLQKVAVIISALFKAAHEPVVRQSLGANKRKRKMLLGAGDELAKIMKEAVQRMTEKAKEGRRAIEKEKNEAEKKINDGKREVREAAEKEKKDFVEMRTAEILRQDKGYQDTCDALDRATATWEKNRYSNGDQNLCREAEIEKEALSKKKDRKEKDARTQAEGEAFKRERNEAGE